MFLAVRIVKTCICMQAVTPEVSLGPFFYVKRSRTLGSQLLNMYS